MPVLFFLPIGKGPSAGPTGLLCSLAYSSAKYLMVRTI